MERALSTRFARRVTLFPGPDIQEYSWILRNPSTVPGIFLGRRRGGLGVYTPIFGDFLPRATIFLVLTAFNSVLPELVVLISTTNSGGTALNAADRILTRKVVARGSKIGVSTPSPPRLHLLRRLDFRDPQQAR